MNDLAILILRVGIAWMFAYPLHLFWKNFNGAKQAASLINKKYSFYLAIIMLLIMTICSLTILLGICVRTSSFCLLVFSLLGVYAHTKLSNISKSIEDGNAILKSIAVEGQLTSAWKNYPIVTICLYLLLIGGGKYCLIPYF